MTITFLAHIPQIFYVYFVLNLMLIHDLLRHLILLTEYLVRLNCRYFFLGVMAIKLSLSVEVGSFCLPEGYRFNCNI